MTGTARIAAVAAAGLVCGACSGSTGPDTGPDPAPSLTSLRLEGAVGSLQQLAFVALEGVATGDRARLEGVRLTEYQHNVLVWPELPASRPEANYPVDWAWQNISVRNHRALGRLVARYEGHNLSLLGVECREDPELFASFRVLKDCWVTYLMDRERAGEEQFFKYVLDWNGQYKIFRYYDPD
jgi:hypothetical protein